MAPTEIADLLREIQKIQKELQPVRTAIATLKKRETETPNPQAAAASLVKVATRLNSVIKRYEPPLTRLDVLLNEEVPSYLAQTSLLCVPEKCFDTNRLGTSSSAAAASPPRTKAGHQVGSAKDPSTHFASFLKDVCPPALPHLLQPENFQFTRQQLQLRAEIVEYLIETDRLPLALHVVASYSLPVSWFPKLAAMQCEQRDKRYSVGTTQSFSKSMASPLITPASRPPTGSQLPKTPIMLPSSSIPSGRNPPFASPVGAGPRGSSATGPSSANAGSNESPLMLRSPLMLPRGAKQQLKREDRIAHPPGPSLPNLVARVVAASMYLKDEYMDRMTLQRIVEMQWLKEQQQRSALDGPRGLTASKDDEETRESEAEEAKKSGSRLGFLSFLPPRIFARAGTEGNAHDNFALRYNSYVTARAGAIPLHHLHTQSGDDVFDTTMMSIIEEVVTHGLRHWSTEIDETPRGGGSTAVKHKRRQGKAPNNLILSPDELRLADDIWNEEVLFLKRPTRFYCPSDGCSSDDPASVSTATPQALRSGEVISSIEAKWRAPKWATHNIFVT